MISGGRSGRDDGAVGHDHQPAALPRLLHVVRGDEHAGPGLRRSGDRLPQPGPAERVDAGGGLVENQQVGLVRQGLGERDPALRPERQRADQVTGRRA